MGMRFRLKRCYFRKNLHRFPKGSQSRAIFTALYRYGIINADNGASNWYITGARSKRLERRRPEQAEGRAGQSLRRREERGAADRQL